jgi:hypothetical protein
MLLRAGRGSAGTLAVGDFSSCKNHNFDSLLTGVHLHTSFPRSVATPGKRDVQIAGTRLCEATDATELWLHSDTAAISANDRTRVRLADVTRASADEDPVVAIPPCPILGVTSFSVVDERENAVLSPLSEDARIHARIDPGWPQLRDGE